MIACVHLPMLPLQLLLRREPEWRAHAVAVVDREAPTGRLLWVNQRAWGYRVRPGMRYAAALTLAPDLRAATVLRSELEAALARVREILLLFSPSVERVVEPSGLFFVVADGLERLFPSLEQWAIALEEALQEQEFHASVVVGFERFAVSSLALARYEGRVLQSPEQERQMMARVPLSRLSLDTKLLSRLEQLGVRTLGQVLRLPRAELRRRLGDAADRLFLELARGERLPVQAQPVEEALALEQEFDFAERNVGRLVERLESMLPSLLARLEASGEALRALDLWLRLERAMGESQAQELHSRLQPASPTLELRLIVELVQLRLGKLSLEGGVEWLRIQVHGVRIWQEQVRLDTAPPSRSLEAANRALARLRAELGEQAVGRFVLEDGILPEARIVWTPLVGLKSPNPDSGSPPQLVRRLHFAPRVLPPRQRAVLEGWHVGGAASGPVVQSRGPFILSGGWWSREIGRELHYLETAAGQLLQVFYDRRRHRWFLQGEVE